MHNHLRKNISIDSKVHSDLVAHIGDGDRKIGKFTEAAIKEKIEREKNKLKNETTSNR